MNIKSPSKRGVLMPAVSGVLALGSALALVVPSAAVVPVVTGVPVGAHAAQNLSIDEAANMHIVGYPKGRVVNERGTVSGTYRGSVKAQFVAITNTKWTATLTVYTKGGSLKAKATARARLKKEEEVFGTGHFFGTASIAGGTGTWAHTSGRLTFHGSINRRTFHVSVNISGTLHLRSRHMGKAT